MSLKNTIDQDIKEAMKAKDQGRLTALRSIKSLILIAETEKGASNELTPDIEMKLLTKAAKQRKESFDLFNEQGRDDLASKEAAELEIINRYLPEQLSEDELKSELKRIVDELGATGPQDMGKVMGAATKSLAGKADGKVISQIVKELLTP
ncbi:MAG: GatB/YqeY domain-containing protein [Bacteroidetes bacterium]|nr:GatB/YqeY domain-containing protein [Bacteroidota bacterium]MDA1119265.1 GatB/YqeY domain-containing protein [Bacteroidota bacterium]